MKENETSLMGRGREMNDSWFGRRWSDPVAAALFVLWATAVAPCAGEEGGPTEGGPTESIAMRPGDSVNISVFGEPSLQGVFTLGDYGDLAFPLLGTLSAAGNAPAEFAQEVEKLLEANFIKDAHVSVTIVGRPPQKISIIGEVHSPGVTEFPAGVRVNLFAAVAAAGGMTGKADTARIQIQRRDGKTTTGSSVTLDASHSVDLEGGDTVIVPALLEVPAITVLGEVRKPGALAVTRGSEIDLLEAIAVTGGFTDFARASKVTVRRRSSSGVKIFIVDVSQIEKEGTESFILAPGDTVIVPQRIF